MTPVARSNNYTHIFVRVTFGRIEKTGEARRESRQFLCGNVHDVPFVAFNKLRDEVGDVRRKVREHRRRRRREDTEKRVAHKNAFMSGKGDRGTAREAAAPKNHPRQSANRLLQYRTPAATRNTRARVCTYRDYRRKRERREREEKERVFGTIPKYVVQARFYSRRRRNHRAKRVSSLCVQSVLRAGRSNERCTRDAEIESGASRSLMRVTLFSKFLVP